MDASARRPIPLAAARLLVVAALLAAAGVARADPTALELNPGAAGAAWTARYSQGVSLEARLTSRGAPVVGERVVFSLAPSDAPDEAFVIEDPITDGNGVARARLTLVDGRHGGQQFQGAGTQDAEAFSYVVTAQFLGRNPPSPADCAAEADAGVAEEDAGVAPLCPSEAEGELRVTLELPTVELGQLSDLVIGETVQLVAVLQDPNGDAPQAGTAVDGEGPQPIAGGTISFFYDVDGNGRPSLNERLGTATTDANGFATFDFTADPAFVRAGDFEAGIHVQYAGDDRRYALAGDSTRLTILTAEPDPSRTLLEVDPEEAPADGFTIVKITARLVDEFGNLLDVNAPDFDVVFTTDLGTLVESPSRDPVTGFYEQDLKAPRAGGTATIGVTVEGAAGPTAKVSFLKEGCACAASPRSAAPALLALLLLPWLALRPGRRRG